MARAVAASRSFARLTRVLERADRVRPDVLCILTYHRISDGGDVDLDPALISATPAEFERQMRYLADNRPLLSLSDLLAIRRGERALPPGAVLVTFDDGYSDFASAAWPAARRAGVPLTLFLPTAYPGERDAAFWWDKLHAALARTSRRDTVPTPTGPVSLATDADRLAASRRMRDWVWATPHVEAMAGVDALITALGTPPATSGVLGWDTLRSLCADGLEIASQTQTHPMVNRLPLEVAQREIMGGMNDLEREIGSCAPVFAFPAGGYSDEIVDWLGDAGFELGFTTERGGNNIRTGNWLRLRRFNVGQRCNVPLMRMQLLSWVADPSAPGGRMLVRA